MQDKIKVSNSQFMKWRCLVALAHLDGVVTKEESNMLKFHFGRQNFTREQLGILSEDLATAQDFKVLYAQIENKKDRADLVQLAYTLFWSDNDFHEAERKVYDYLVKDNLGLIE